MVKKRLIVLCSSIRRNRETGRDIKKPENQEGVSQPSGFSGFLLGANRVCHNLDKRYAKRSSLVNKSKILKNLRSNFRNF